VDRPSEGVWKLIDTILNDGHAIGITLRPDGDLKGPPVSITVEGFQKFTGETLQEAALKLADTRCWRKLTQPDDDDDIPMPTDPPPAAVPSRPTGPRRSVHVADIIDEVEQIAEAFVATFRADEIADMMNIHASAVGQALKKLEWPRHAQKTWAIVEGREHEVYVYIPRGS
jgi:hypothetical protein